MPKITQYEILQIIKCLSSKKAPGPDQIPNKVLKAIICKICSYLDYIFNDFLRSSHYFINFRKFIIVCLRKHEGNQDYTKLKNYQPISLLNILGKNIEVGLAIIISYMARKYNFLPKIYFKSQYRSCIEIAIHNFFNKAYIV